MNALAYLRHPITLLAAVSCAIGFIWYVLGLPVQMPPSPLAAGGKLECAAYAPEVAATTEVPLPRIESDLNLLARHHSCVRTYRTGAGMDRVPEIAARLGLTVLQGVALGRSAEENRAEIERAVALSRSQRAVIRAFVAGSDVLARRLLRPSEHAAMVRQIRERTTLPVTASELPETWIDADLLAPAVDFILLRVPLYDARFPVSHLDAARHVRDARSAVAKTFSNRSVVVEAGWPSAGRMRDAALPSPANQARVLHEIVMAAKSAGFQFSLIEGIDQPARAASSGTAAAHWGTIQSVSGEPKFRWGGAVLNFPLSFMQALTGMLFAFVIFAAGFLSARSSGPRAPAAVGWEAVAIIALAGGASIGWAVADLPTQSHSPGGWALGSALLLLAIAAPPVCAAAVVRRAPFEGFSALLDPRTRNAAHPLTRAVGGFFLLTVLFILPVGVMLAVDPSVRDFPFAVLTGPAAAFLVLTAATPGMHRRESIAEAAAAIVLAVSALLIVFNESFWNWQALWLAAALASLALACWRVRAVRMR